jgi:outer membrane lipoprotein SlyB
MHRGVLGICVLVGSTIGGLLPTLAGAGTFSLASFVGSVAGAIVGVFAAARLTA